MLSAETFQNTTRTVTKAVWVSSDRVQLHPHKWLRMAQGDGEPTLTLLSLALK